MIQDKLFEPILNIVVETMPRDNLLNSACLEFFDFIRREGIKPLICHLVETYRETLKTITYVDIFSNFIVRYDQTQGFSHNLDSSIVDSGEETPKRSDIIRGGRWENGIKDLDDAEEAYFNTSDDEEDVPLKLSDSPQTANGASPVSKPLVDYPSDEENDAMDMDNTEKPGRAKTPESNASSKDTSDDFALIPTSSASVASPPERVTEKRRREEDEEDELGKLSHNKRRNSSSSVSSNTSSVLRRKKNFVSSREGNGATKTAKIAISISPAIKTGGESGGEGEN